MLGGKGREGKKEGVRFTYICKGDEKEKRVESFVSMPTGPAPNLLGQALSPFLSFLYLLLSTYPSLDRRVLSSKTAAVKVLDHKALGDRHDPTLLHHQGLGVGLNNAVGADSGL